MYLGPFGSVQSKMSSYTEESSPAETAVPTASEADYGYEETLVRLIFWLVCLSNWARLVEVILQKLLGTRLSKFIEIPLLQYQATRSGNLAKYHAEKQRGVHWISMAWSNMKNNYRTIGLSSLDNECDVNLCMVICKNLEYLSGTRWICRYSSGRLVEYLFALNVCPQMDKSENLINKF